MKNLPVAILALVGGALIFWPQPADDTTPDPSPVVENDILEQADEAYRQELARLVLKHSGGDWTTSTKKQWAEDVAAAREKTHSDVMDRLAKAFAEGAAASLVEPIRNGEWQ